jgi:shikimate dehydrogenase
MTKPYAEVIGDPIAQSKSPAIHNFWLAKLGIAGEYRATRVDLASLDAYLAARRADKAWRGCNVTMPLKQALFGEERLDWGVARAVQVGAVNTIIKKRGKLTGDNTDLAGFEEPLIPLLRKQHLFRMARVIGTGGAARAVLAVLDRHDFTIVLAGRDSAKARKLLDELAPQKRNGPEHHAIDLAHFADPTDFPFDDREGCLDLVINASSLGMIGQPPLAFDWSHAPPGAIAYDIVTAPLDTPFLQAARAKGHRTIDGLSMLIGQAAVAFEHFFGQPPPRQYDAELRALLTA